MRFEECLMTRRDLLTSIAAAVLLAAISFGSSLFAQKNSQPPSPRKIQVLIITGRDDHDWRGVTPLMRQYLDAAGIFETRIAEEFRDAGPNSLEGYDVAVLVYNDKLAADEWSERSHKTLLDFVKAGKGLVVYHHSAA